LTEAITQYRAGVSCKLRREACVLVQGRICHG
jgi:hypothetical protein